MDVRHISFAVELEVNLGILEGEVCGFFVSDLSLHFLHVFGVVGVVESFPEFGLSLAYIHPVF